MLLTALTFFFVLSILVFIHELGHFAVAKWVGVAVEEFGFGLPPRIFGKKIGKTVYSINWLPIGGFVKLAGEDEEEVNQKSKVPSERLGTGKSQKYLFWARSRKERSLILIAGVVMNFFLAVGITTYLLIDGVMEPSGRVHVENIQPGTPAAIAGIQAGDVIVGVSKYPKITLNTEPRLTKPGELIQFAKGHAGSEVVLEIDRGGKSIVVRLTPRKNPPSGEGAMGVVVSDLEKKTYSLGEAPVKAVEINLSRAREMLVSLGSTLWRLITLQKFQADVAGPIGIAQVTGEAVKYGFRAVLELMSILSLNLAILNVLPFPALDGGRLAFVFLEKIFGRRIKPAFERSTHQIGMIILIVLILLVSFNDILRLAHGS